MDIKIIGGGPAGCHVAMLLAKNHDVELYEAHQTIGSPVQCTGIVTQSFSDIIRPKKNFIQNKSKLVRIYSPNKEFLELKFKKPEFILDRQAFDQYLAKQARKAGCNINLEHRFQNIEGKDLIIRDLKAKKNKRIRASILIGADGPNSEVAKTTHIFGKRQFFTGIQARIKKKNDNYIEFYPYINDLGWAVPEDHNTLRVGIISRNKPKQVFDDFIKRFKGRIIEKQAGSVPIYSPRLKSSSKRTFLIGDSATMVKATTGGGIVQGLFAGQCLKKAIEKEKDYEMIWKREIGKDLWMHLTIRKALDKFTDNDWNRMINLCKRENITNLLQKKSRDKPWAYFSTAILKEPKCLTFALRKMLGY